LSTVYGDSGLITGYIDVDDAAAHVAKDLRVEGVVFFEDGEDGCAWCRGCGLGDRCDC